MSDPTRSDVDLPALDPSWWSWHSAHGGLLAAMMMRHARRLAGGMAPRSVHASFLAPVRTAPLRLSTEVQHRNLSSAVTRSTLHHDGQPAATATALFAEDATEDSTLYRKSRVPDVPDVADCPELDLLPDLIPVAQHLSVRMAPGARPLAGGEEAQLAAWIRLKNLDLEPAEAVFVLLDSMPPALYGVLDEPVPVPSAEISVRFTDQVTDGSLDDWALIQVRTEQAGSGWTLESGSLWTPDGTLLGVSLQTRRIVAPAADLRDARARLPQSA
ncbi:thioesterase family protein [Streptomyces sp. NBC_01304]|uniref:thioesterase family protein n=1 Tax=Streptomyces sp. NBC_01304 TaxID=2903818 RepID=UPI002E12A54B|nr:thioesterase family protein [Streptomyces sp. NBC_01304]